MEDQYLDKEFLTPDKFYHATFWDRVWAYLLDGLILLPATLFIYYNFIFIKSFALNVVIGLIAAAYKPILEWLFGATPGKMILKLKVVTEEYKKAGLVQVTARSGFYLISSLLGLIHSYFMFADPNFQKITNVLGLEKITEISLNSPVGNATQLAGMLILISVIFVIFHDKRQALHDIIAKTYVVKTNALVEEDKME